ncbi:hypothetical protein LLG46_04910 [bacterium]|nr:hypothetical protein [bacterium]
MGVIEPTYHSLRYREIAAHAWPEIVLPHLRRYFPALIETAFYAICSSVAYGLADEHSDIDTLLIIPSDDYNAHETELVNWAYSSPEIATFSQSKKVNLRVKVSTWQREGVSILFDGNGSWDNFYNCHQHWVQSLIPVYDPRGQMQIVYASLARMPEGLAERAAKQCASQLADIRCVLQELDMLCRERFVGLLAYSIVSRTLPFLFHREKALLPFHKWQWPLAERLSEESKAVLQQLRAMLEGQIHSISFPQGLIGNEVERIASRALPLPIGIDLSPEETERALASIQWHLDERGCYQMVRARARGWREASLQYMCATRCLLIKGTILLEIGRIACGEGVSVMWEQVHKRVPGLEDCLWPQAGEDPFGKTLQGIDILRHRFRCKHALPQQYLNCPLSSPPSYDLACILEEL